MANSKAGGGINSRVNVRPPSKMGQAARGVNPGHVAQDGLALGNKAMNDPKRLNPAEPKFTQSPPSPKLGNQTALSAGQGPGSGRSVMRSGSQAQHGAPEGRPAPTGGDILSSFGPERGGR
jgi:hypothetical protein